MRTVRLEADLTMRFVEADFNCIMNVRSEAKVVLDDDGLVADLYLAIGGFAELLDSFVEVFGESFDAVFLAGRILVVDEGMRSECNPRNSLAPWIPVLHPFDGHTLVPLATHSQDVSSTAETT